MREDRDTRKSPRWMTVATTISDWGLYVLSAFSAVILFIDLVWGLDQMMPAIKDRLPTIILAALSTFFASSVLERKSKIEVIEQQLEQTMNLVEAYKGDVANVFERQRAIPAEMQQFYRSLRRELPLHDFIAKAQNEILLVGTTFYHLIERLKPLFTAKSKTCEIRFLAMNPHRKNRPLIAGVAALFREEDSFSGELRRSCQRLLKYQEEILQKGGRMTVRMYSSVPTVNVVMVDPDEPTGAIQVEILPYKGSANMRPGFVLRPSGAGADLYNLFRTQYKMMWDEADELTSE
jgi:hypothetical protein